MLPQILALGATFVAGVIVGAKAHESVEETLESAKQKAEDAYESAQEALRRAGAKFRGADDVVDDALGAAKSAAKKPGLSDIDEGYLMSIIEQMMAKASAKTAGAPAS